VLCYGLPKPASEYAMKDARPTSPDARVVRPQPKPSEPTACNERDFTAAVLDIAGALIVVLDRQAAEAIVEVARQLFGGDACKFNLYSRKPDGITQVFAQDTIDGQKVECPPPGEQREPSAFTRQIIDHGAKLVLKDPSTPLAGAVAGASSTPSKRCAGRFVHNRRFCGQ
jgi:hypothetical protein